MGLLESYSSTACSSSEKNNSASVMSSSSFLVGVASASFIWICGLTAFTSLYRWRNERSTNRRRLGDSGSAGGLTKKKVRMADDDQTERNTERDITSGGGNYVKGDGSENLKASSWEEKEADTEGSTNPSSAPPRRADSFMERLTSIGNRIGELPSRTSRWPWRGSKKNKGALQTRMNDDTSQQQEAHQTLSPSSSYNDGNNKNNSGMQGGGDTSADDDDDDDDDSNHGINDEKKDDEENKVNASTSSHEKTGLCIGSIFGLDVGGTLAKLVYFEQQPQLLSSSLSNQRHFGGTHHHHHSSSSSSLDGNDLLIGHFRRRHTSYHLAASAQAVLLSRRGQQEFENGEQDTSEKRSSFFNPIHRHSRNSDDDLKIMYQVRQESLPDDLNEFAESCHVQVARFNTNDSLRKIIMGKKKEEKDDLQTQLENATHKTTTTTRSGANNYDWYDDGASSDASSSTSACPTSPRTMMMKKSKSMFDLSKSRDHAEALDRFYNFVRRLDTYETGVKDKELSFYSRELGGEFHFIRFETRRMESAMELIRVNNLHLNIVEMGATGGGAHKFAADWDRVLGIKMVKQDELDSLVAGMQFVLADVVGECYTFKPKVHHHHDVGGDGHGVEKQAGDAQAEHVGTMGNNAGRRVPSKSSSTVSASSTTSNDSGTGSQSSSHVGLDSESSSTEANVPSQNSQRREHWWSRKVQRDVITNSETYPYLLVSIGTGVSVLRVDGPRKYERISGSTIGGGTYWGLCRLLMDVDNFEDVLKLAKRGDPSKVDMMVGDIYGKNSDALEKLGLPTHIVASSFGKLVAKRDPAAGIKEEDLAIALLLMVTNNIGQVAYLNAQLHKTPRIYFIGNFLRENIISQQRLAYAINYWSGGEMEALFLEHEGYFGALGAFLLSQNISHSGGGAVRRRRFSKSQSVSSHTDGSTLLPRPCDIPGRQRSKSLSQLDDR